MELIRPRLLYKAIGGTEFTGTDGYDVYYYQDY
jgi:hypothetical protein